MFCVSFHRRENRSLVSVEVECHVHIEGVTPRRLHASKAKDHLHTQTVEDKTIH
jgi:hypothetical protein